MADRSEIIVSIPGREKRDIYIGPALTESSTNRAKTSLSHLLSENGRFPETHSEKSPFRIVFNRDFADPSVLRVSDGREIAYATETVQDGNYFRIQGAFSDGEDNWSPFGRDLLTGLPQWLNYNSHFWAPYCLETKEGDFLNYYALEIKENVFGISVAKSDRPDGNFKDYTKAPIVFGTEIDKSRDIDPHVAYSSDGRKILTWGSAGAPIMQRYLTDDGMAFAPGSETKAILDILPTAEYERVVEAAFPITFNGVEYLFYSGADCFANGPMNVNGEDLSMDSGYFRYGNYAILYAIKNPITGNYERPVDENGNLDNILVEGNEYFKNPGNNSVIIKNGRMKGYAHVIDRSDQYRPNLKTSFINRRPMFAFDIQQLANGKLYVEGGRFPLDEKKRIRHFR